MKDVYPVQRTVLRNGESTVETYEVGTPELCDLVRTAREQRQISLRELARRSGVSAGQISRIESGDVQRPEVGTLEAIANAFGRPAEPLLFITGRIDEDEFYRRVTSLEEALGVSWGIEGVSVEDAAAGLWSQADPELMSARIGGDNWVKNREGLDEIAAAWPALTPERRRLILAFVADQEVLSMLDRMPSPPGRYELDVVLTERGASDE